MCILDSFRPTDSMCVENIHTIISCVVSTLPDMTKMIRYIMFLTTLYRILELLGIIMKDNSVLWY